MINGKRLRVLVVDDTVVYRMIMSEILSEFPDVEVVGTANNGKIALSKIALLKPDLLSLDIEMPEMDGLEVLANMKKDFPGVGAVMVSALTYRGGEMTMKALDLGAFDFILKPENRGMEENKQAIRDTIAPILKAFARHREIKTILNRCSFPSAVKRKEKRGVERQGVIQRMEVLSARKRGNSEIVAIGISTGGPKALGQMMPRLPSNLGVPIFIAQHMPPLFTKALATKLDSECALAVKEARDGETVRPNTAFVAPGGKQMKIVASPHSKDRIVRITDDPPENSCRPSADYLFRSVSDLYGTRATGVIMTGMGSDGTSGLKLMKAKGAAVIAQDEKTCVVYGMPKGPADAGIVDVIAPLDRIAEEIVKTIRH